MICGDAVNPFAIANAAVAPRLRAPVGQNEVGGGSPYQQFFQRSEDSAKIER